MSVARVVNLLNEIACVLDEVDEESASGVLRRLAQEVESADNRESRREALGKVLSLYGGMGSFQDLVLQDARGVLPQQESLESCKRGLYREAIALFGD